MNEANRQVTGSCLCGGVHFKATADSNEFGACHCGMCRKWVGGPLLALECAGKVEFTGEDNIGVFASSDWAERGFCKRCGSHLFYRLTQAEHYAIPVGLLDQRDSLAFTQQIFIEEKPPYYDFANQTKNLTGEELFAMFGADSSSDN